MNYRTLGKTGIDVSALGFGTMRLPVRGTEADVDEPLAAAMLRYAVDRGVNYVDTGYPYHGGNSERVVGKALEHGYRQKVYLATKLPVWEVNSLEDCDRLFDEQLARLQTDRVDFYLLHCLQAKTWPKMRDLGVLGWLERLKANGRIGDMGFSFHDKFDVFRDIVDGYDWPLCQIQYNFVNEDVQAGTPGLKYAAGKGLGVVVMEPLFGGTLARPPQAIREIWENVARDCRPADLALRWLWDRPEVSLVLSGMSTPEQVEQNLESARRSGVGWLDEEEVQLIRRLQRKYGELSPIPCTKCGYCAPCPNGVDIPRNFELYNNATLFGGNATTLCKNLYASLPAQQKAAACAACGTCEEKCPQQIEIGAMMPRVEAALGMR